MNGLSWTEMRAKRAREDRFVVEKHRRIKAEKHAALEKTAAKPKVRKGGARRKGVA